MPVAFSFRVVVGSALRSCSGWTVRTSSHSFSGAVVAVRFASFAAAAAFAQRWSGRCGVSCLVRRSSVAGSFFVAIPCLWGGF